MSADERFSDTPPREVARLEEVLTIASTDGTDRIAAETRAAAMPEVQPARTDADETPADVHAAPVNEVQLRPSDDRRDIDWVRLRREVARLEEVLTIASTDGTDRVAAEAAAPVMPEVQPARTETDETLADINTASVRKLEVPTSDETHVSKPSPVAAHTLREAFWFEQASAFKPLGNGERTTGHVSQAAVPDVVLGPDAAVSTSTDVEPDRREADAHPCAEPNGSQSLVCLEISQTSRRPWVVAICLLALIGLVAVLTGRDLRRFLGGQPS